MFIGTVIAVDGNASDARHQQQVIERSLQRTNEELERRAVAVQLAATLVDVNAHNSFEMAHSRALRPSHILTFSSLFYVCPLHTMCQSPEPPTLFVRW